MEATKQVKFDDLLDNYIDMSKVKLDALKAQIKTKIYDIFKIEEFVYNELELGQFICPMKMHIHITEFLNGSLVKQFICELWPILLAVQESAAAIPNDAAESKKDEIPKEVKPTKRSKPTKKEILKKVFQTKLRKDAERSKSQSRKQGDMVDSSSVLKPQENVGDENVIKQSKKHDESASLSLSTNSKNSGTESSTQTEQKQHLAANTLSTKKQQPAKENNENSTNIENHTPKLDKPVLICRTQVEQKQPLVPHNTFGSNLKPQQRISMLNGGKLPLVPRKTLTSNHKPQGRIDISKVKLDVLKPWISKKITDILQREDNAAVEFVYNKLKQDKMLCKERLKIRIAGFLIGDKAQKFVCELWPLLLSAQESESGIPAELKQQLSREKHDGSASPSRLTNSQNNNTGISTKAEQKQHLTTSTLSTRKQQPDKENNTCGFDNFANICMHSPQQKNANVSSQDQHRLLHCAEMDEFLKDWNKTPEKETILFSKKFIYPNEKNIKQQINATLLPAAGSVSKSDYKQERRNIDFDKIAKAEEEIKAARKLQSRKRSHSTMVNESKKSRSDSSNKDKQQPAKKHQAKAKKSSSKRSSDKVSACKPEDESNKKETNKKYDVDASKKPVVESKENEDHKQTTSVMNKLELDLFGSMSSDEEESSSEQPPSTNSEAVTNNHNIEMSTLEVDLSISSDEEDA